MKIKKIPAARLLVERGAFASESAAEGWILSGQVLIDGKPVTSKGQLVANGAPVRIKSYNKQYVGRGGIKLTHALAAFSIDVRGKVALDTGASVGGFTDCLLKNGAARVYAVEAGVGQLHGSLRNDARVVNLENTNIGEPSLAALMQPPPTIASVDIGYLSLRKAIPLIFPLMGVGAEVVCLVKPLFEIDDALVRRTGEITEGAYLPIIKSLTAWMRENGYYVKNITHSPIPGGKGTREFFLHVREEAPHNQKEEASPGQKADAHPDLDEAAEEAVRRVLEIPDQPEDEDGYF